jgi:hypothetical protein
VPPVGSKFFLQYPFQPVVCQTYHRAAYKVAQKSVNWLVRCTTKYVRNFFIKCTEIVRNEILRVEYALYKAVIQFWKLTGRFKSEHSRDSAVGIAAGYGLDDRGVGVRVPVGSRIFSSPRRPDWRWDPPKLLSNGYRWFFPRG